MMQLPLLSAIFGLGGPPAQPQPGGEAGAASASFANLLANVPAQAGQTPPELPLAKAAMPVAVPADPALQAGLQAELSAALTPQASANSALPLQAVKPAAHGKITAEPGRFLPLLPLTAAELAPDAISEMLPAEFAASTERVVTDKPEAAPAPFAYADLALLHIGAPQFAAPAEARVKTPDAAPVPERQLATVAALGLPMSVRPGKERAIPVVEGANPAISPEPADLPAAPTIAASIPLSRPQAARQPLGLHALEPAPALQPAPQLAEPQSGGADTAPNLPDFQQPAMPEAELGTVIDRLVETRIQSREGRSEINLPHPDFGRVTLALSLAGQDRLSIAMPDAPAELRNAVGQAFAPPPRAETAPAAPTADSGLSTSSDPRSQDARRDPQSSSGRSDPSRSNTYGADNRQFTTNSDNHRKPSGRGVLA